jgi:hypothetical protein
MLIKVYKAASGGERRYSPAEVSSVEIVPVMGQPDPDRICTSIVERSNLSLRMGTRRCTRLTNAFSKKWENHWAAMSLWYTCLQLLPDSQIVTRHARDGGRNLRSHLECSRTPGRGMKGLLEWF